MAKATKPATGSQDVLLVKRSAAGASDYRRFSISRFKAFSTLNSSRGRLYANRKTMQTTHKAYPTWKKAQARMSALIRFWEARGFHHEQGDSFGREPKKAVAYDKAKWHAEGDSPADLSPEAAATHIGLFLTWCLRSGLGSAEFLADSKREISRLERRALTPGAFLLEVGGALVSDQLTEVGDAFARAYYNGRNDDSPYFNDYARTFRVDDDDFYRVSDSWRSFGRLKPVIARRYRAWLAKGKPKKNRVNSAQKIEGQNR